MPESQPNSAVRRRSLIHRRRIEVEGYLREDGLFDLEARLVDTKGRDYALATGVRPAGAAIHDMVICVTIDRRMVVQSVQARTDASPYPGACERIAPQYADLAGLDLMRGFRQAVRERFSGLAGCSHLSELLMSVPTAALQTLATFVRDNEETAHKPFQLDRCHALDTTGETVRQYYPRWYVGS